jgi:hypothetical protein
MRHLLIIAIIFFTTGCGEQDTFTKEEQQQVVNEVKQMMQHYCEDVKAGGLTAEFKYLDSSADFFWVPPGYKSPLSYNSIASILRKNAPSMRSVANSYDILHIVPLDKYHAVYTAIVLSIGTDTAGNTGTTKLIETGTVIKREDGWKLLCGQTAMITK